MRRLINRLRGRWHAAILRTYKFERLSHAHRAEIWGSNARWFPRKSAVAAVETLGKFMRFPNRGAFWVTFPYGPVASMSRARHTLQITHTLHREPAWWEWVLGKSRYMGIADQDAWRKTGWSKDFPGIPLE